MKASLRVGIAAFAAALTPAPATAQDVQLPATNAPAPDTVGPRELRNFELNGTVTRPAPTEPQPQPQPAAPADQSPETTAPAPSDQPARPRDRVSASPAPAQVAEPGAPSVPEASSPASTTDVDSGAPAPSDRLFTTQPNFAPPVIPEEATQPIEQGGALWPWLFAAIFAAGGIGFLAWRQNRRGPLTAGNAPAHAFEAPPPAPQPVPVPAQRPQPVPETRNDGMIVSTRLRPWLDIELIPGRCLLDAEKAVIQFEVNILNSGNSPARDVLVEACMFNGGADQDRQIGQFFDNPTGEGERVTIPPLKRLNIQSAVVLPRDQMQVFEAGGRQFFVPMLAFNALYRWGGGEGQTSSSYLVGRDTKGEKLAPFRVDLGARVFRGLGAREHALRVRR